MEQLESLRFCAFCPNPCRRAWPAEAHAQNEAMTPSALSLLTVHVAEGRIALDRDVEGLLASQDMARTCSAVCPYGLDIPALIGHVLQHQPKGAGDAKRRA